MAKGDSSGGSTSNEVNPMQNMGLGALPGMQFTQGNASGQGMPQQLGQMGSAIQASNTAVGNGYPQISTGGPLMAMRFSPQQYPQSSQPLMGQQSGIGNQQDFWSKLIQSFTNQPGMNYFNRMQ